MFLEFRIPSKGPGTTPRQGLTSVPGSKKGRRKIQGRGGLKNVADEAESLMPRVPIRELPSLISFKWITVNSILASDIRGSYF